MNVNCLLTSWLAALECVGGEWVSEDEEEVFMQGLSLSNSGLWSIGFFPPHIV